MIIERIDMAESDVAHWILSRLLPEFSSLEVKSMVMFTQLENGQLDTTIDNVKSFQLAPFTKDQIKGHLQFEFGFPSDKAESEANYLLSLGSGMPGGVHRGFSIKRLEGVKVI